MPCDSPDAKRAFQAQAETAAAPRRRSRSGSGDRNKQRVASTAAEPNTLSLRPGASPTSRSRHASARTTGRLLNTELVAQNVLVEASPAPHPTAPPLSPAPGAVPLPGVQRERERAPGGFGLIDEPERTCRALMQVMRTNTSVTVPPGAAEPVTALTQVVSSTGGEPTGTGALPTFPVSVY